MQELRLEPLHHWGNLCNALPPLLHTPGRLAGLDARLQGDTRKGVRGTEGKNTKAPQKEHKSTTDVPSTLSDAFHLTMQ